MRFNLIIASLTIGMLSAGVYDKTFARNHDDKHDRIFDANHEGQTDNFRLIDNQPQEIAIDIEENMEWLLNLAYTCYEDDNYVAAFTLYNVLANHENCTAQCNLAWMYAHALGTERNDIFAASWFIRAIEQGYDDAISMAERCDANVHFNLGLVYTICAAIQENGYEKAFRWYKLAAENGHTTSQCYIGEMYSSGNGVEANSKEAVKWYKLAMENGNNNALNGLIDMAEHDDIDAQYTLGEMYENGQGVEKNYDEAAKWYKRAADQGSGKAILRLSEFAQKGDASALSYLIEKAEAGNPNAQDELGFMYFYGHGVKQNYDESVKWYKKAADQEFPIYELTSKLSAMAMTGNTSALSYLVEMAECGDVVAQSNLGNMYQKGLGVNQNYDEAVKWYKEAAHQGYYIRVSTLSDMVQKGSTSALSYLVEKAENGNHIAQIELGDLYKKGHGVEQNYDEALKWYKRAVDQGDDLAQRIYERLQKQVEEQK